jgi:hypothetical protein
MMDLIHEIAMRQRDNDELSAYIKKIEAERDEWRRRAKFLWEGMGEDARDFFLEDAGKWFEEKEDE